MSLLKLILLRLISSLLKSNNTSDFIDFYNKIR